MVLIFRMNVYDTANDLECPYILKHVLSKLRFTILCPPLSNDNANSWQNFFNSIRCTSNEYEIFPKFMFWWLRLNLWGIFDPTVGPLFPKSRKVNLFFSQCNREYFQLNRQIFCLTFNFSLRYFCSLLTKINVTLTPKILD